MAGTHDGRQPAGGPVSSARAAEIALVAVVCLCFALGSLPGFVSHARDHLTPDHQDPLLNLVLLKWGAHQWRLGLPDFWNANFFFPTRGVIALSDHLLGPALALALLGALGVGPILAYNLLLLGALTTSPLALHLLLRRLGLSAGASLVAALGWGFAACRVAHVGHLQLLFAFFVPILLWSFDRLLERPSWGAAAGFALVYAFHLSGGSYLAYMAHVPLLAVAAARWRAIREAARTPRLLLPLALAGAACGAVGSWLYLPYARSAAALGTVRSPEDWTRFGASWSSFLVAAPRTPLRLAAVERFASPEQALSPGVVTLALVLVGIVFGRPLVRRGFEGALLASALACLALGFAGVFTAAAAVAPGLDGLRVPARFVQLAGIGLALLAARGADAILVRLRPGASLAMVGLLCGAMAWELLPAGTTWHRLGAESEFPAIDHWVAGRPEIHAYVDLPFPPPNRLSREGLAMYLSTLHWKGLVNGRSGYAPPTWQRAYEAIPVMPDADAIELLRGLGVTHVLVREAAMYEGRARRTAYLEWLQRFERGDAPGLEVVHSDASGDRVYRITGSPSIEAEAAHPETRRAPGGPDGTLPAPRRDGE